VLNAVLGFMRVGELQRYYRLDRFGLPMALTAIVGVLLLGVLPGLLIAVALTIVLLLQRISRPHSAVLGQLPDGSGYGDVERYAEAETVPGLLVFRLDAPLFFANVQVLRGRIRTLVSEASPPVQVVLLDTEATSGLDIEGVDALGELQEELKQGGAELWLARVRAPVRGMLERAGLARSIGEEKIYPSVHAGVQAYRDVVKRG
jgi:sulfate permease, SulP family